MEQTRGLFCMWLSVNHFSRMSVCTKCETYCMLNAHVQQFVFISNVCNQNKFEIKFKAS